MLYLSYTMIHCRDLQVFRNNSIKYILHQFETMVLHSYMSVHEYSAYSMPRRALIRVDFPELYRPRKQI